MRPPVCVSLRILLFYTLGWLLAWVEGDADDLSEFLYLREPPESVFPVQEYKATTDGEKPDFLFSEDYAYPRIVEFYAHWCPHCQHFIPKYIELGKQLLEITETLPGGIRVETHAVSCVPNKQICNAFDVHGFPLLKIFPAHSVNGTVLDRGNIHPAKILKTLGISTDRYSAEVQGQGDGVSDTKGSLQGNSLEKELQHKHFMARSKKETFDDAHLSFDFLLRQGIYMAPGALPFQAKGVLNRFVLILSKAVPTSSSLYPAIAALSNNREGIAKSEEALVDLLDGLAPPPSSTWSPACLQHGTGYTCGLWTLFHIVTVGTVEWNLLAGDDDERLAPLDVADALRNFIEHFFQCDDCRAHFLSEYDSCGHDRCNRLSSDKAASTFTEWRELPLWLYETHNGVNTRLRQERLENKENEDTTTEWQVQWPPVYDCPKCWLSQGRWDEEQIYRFLRLEYWPEDYRTSKFQNHLNTDGRKDLHPDVVLAMRKDRTMDEDAELEIPKMPLPMMAIALVAVLSGYAYHRKRKYDLKGYHKKRESFDC
jgi:thiol-disulfide isomerase/thioredoxin